MTRKLTAFLIAFSLLSTLNSIAQVGPDIIWQKSLGGSGDDKANDVIALADGGFMVAGSTKSNNGDVTGHHGSLDSTDAWVCRLDPNGNILWQKSFGGNGNEEFSTIIKSSDGNFLLVGTSASFDGDVVGNHGKTDFWALKIDLAGSVIWSKTFGGTESDNLRTGISTSECGYLLIGNTRSNNGDVSGNHGGNGSDIWFAKITSSGDLDWQKCYGNVIGNDNADDVIEDIDGHFIALVHGSGSGGTDGDFWAENGNDEVQIKINKDNRNIIYTQNGLTGSRFSSNGAIVKTPNGYLQAVNRAINYPLCAVTNGLVKLYMNGTVSQPLITPASCPNGMANFTSNFATAHGLAALSDSSFVGVGSMNDNGSGPNGTYGGSDAFIGLGRFVLGSRVYSSKKFGGSGHDQFTSIKVLSNRNEYIVAGFSNSNTNDVSGNHGNLDFWIVKVAATNKIVGDVFIDENNNGIKDGSEIMFDNAIITTSKTGFSKSSITYGGHYQTDVDTGTFQTTLSLSKPYYTVTPLSKTTSFSAFKLTDTVHFALHPIPGKRDYSVVPVSIGMPRPGFNIGYNIQITNNGSDVLTDRTLSFIKDKRSRFISSIPAQESISGDTITWKINSLNPQQNGLVYVYLKLDSTPSLQLNDTLKTQVYIDSTGDIVPGDNTSFIRQIVRGSFDPNDKQENNGGYLSLADYNSDQYLTYRINFQNTGNDTAFNIYVRDTLDLKTHSSNIEMVSSSHPFRLNVEKNNILVWSFENINLVDSIQNEPLSHGYLIFRVKPKSGLQIGDIIKNRASIYFDYNLPVLTNTVNTVVRLLAPEAPVVSGIKDKYCSSDSIQVGKLLNPSGNTTGTTVLVKLDTAILQTDPDGSFRFDVSTVK
jgi:uncharacterized repeat protein (TIGR01451 family)